MTTPVQGRPAPRCFWLMTTLLLIGGCQTPPAHLNGCSPETANADRHRVLIHQILEDTGEELAHHPGRAGRIVLNDQAAFFGALGRGLFGKRIGMHLHGVPPVCPCATGIDPELFEPNLEPAAVQLYPDGPQALALLEKMIDSAVCRIDVLMYLWDNDEVGWCVARRLAAWAGPNRRVRILIDGGANLTFVPSPNESADGGDASSKPRLPRELQTAGEENRVVCWLAQQPGIELIRIRNPCAHFDHRKMVLIDGQNAWLGGRNFTRAAFFLRRDVTYTMQGPLVAQMQVIYENYWRQQGGQAECALAPLSPHSSPLRGEGSQITPLSPPGRGVGGEGLPPIQANAAGRLVANTPTAHSLRDAVYHALDHARCFAYLENPYFTDNGVIVKLARARRRGVDARVVFTIRSDTPSINHTNKVTANRLLAAGVRVYLYPGRIHTKAALIDGVWGYLGSGNFDMLSLHRNHEIGVVFGPSPIISDVQQVIFQPDLNPEWELTTPLPLTLEDRLYELMAGLFL